MQLFLFKRVVDSKLEFLHFYSLYAPVGRLYLKRPISDRLPVLLGGSSDYLLLGVPDPHLFKWQLERQLYEPELYGGGTHRHLYRFAKLGRL